MKSLSSIKSILLALVVYSVFTCQLCYGISCIDALSKKPNIVTANSTSLTRGTYFNNTYTVESGVPLINGIMMTGAEAYPLEVMISHFGMNREKLLNQLRGKRVLVVATGSAELLPFLIRNGIDAKGLDLWYTDNSIPDSSSLDGLYFEEARRFQSRNQQYIIGGTAERIPMSSQSVDVVISHQLFNGMEATQGSRIISEFARVLSPNGTMLNFACCIDMNGYASDLRRLLSASTSIDLITTQASWDYRGRNIDLEGQLLTVGNIGPFSGLGTSYR